MGCAQIEAVAMIANVKQLPAKARGAALNAVVLSLPTRVRDWTWPPPQSPLTPLHAFAKFEPGDGHRVVLRVPSSRKENTRQLGAERDKAILKLDVVCLRIGGERMKVIEVAAGHSGLWFIAGDEPCLGKVCLVYAVRRGGSAHLGRNPAGLERVRQDIPPPSGHGEAEHHVV
jgi:hypothetical protein